MDTRLPGKCIKLCNYKIKHKVTNIGTLTLVLSKERTTKIIMLKKNSAKNVYALTDTKF